MRQLHPMNLIALHPKVTFTLSLEPQRGEKRHLFSLELYCPVWLPRTHEVDCDPVILPARTVHHYP
jgi:hypothetical protein